MGATCCHRTVASIRSNASAADDSDPVPFLVTSVYAARLHTFCPAVPRKSTPPSVKSCGLVHDAKVFGENRFASGKRHG